MREVKNISGEVLFSYDENETTLREEISNHRNLRLADLSDAYLKGADLSYADLSGADLSGADLKGASLYHTDLSNANLSGADLSGARIKWADLTGANLRNANLTGANLFCTDLTGADLTFTDLRWAKLYNSNLCNVSLKGANLRNANLNSADLTGADLSGADLKGTDLNYAKNIPYIDFPMACPTEGSFIAWKKVGTRYLIKLEIPEDAKRSSATSKKCRCSKAKVLEITDIYTGENIGEVVNFNYAPCTYTMGEMVYPDSFDENRWNECSHGIHFFIDREDAVNYYN